ncbi:MAG TPA: hypothetical protein VIM42_09135 [Clostridium sp.]
MKTLNPEKSKDLFYRIRELGEIVSMLGWAVQNPDFINEENAKENYDFFCTDYKTCSRSLDEISGEIHNLYKEILD